MVGCSCSIVWLWGFDIFVAGTIGIPIYTSSSTEGSYSF